jgi:hypothetical protein
MVAYHLKGYITENGELKIDLPKDIEPGEVEVSIKPVEVVEEKSETEIDPLDQELLELLELLKQPRTPKTGAEIVEWMQKENIYWDIDVDGATWVEQQRRKLSEESKW